MDKVGVFAGSFNAVAGAFQSVRENIPKEVKIFLTVVCDQFKAGPSKAFFLKPIALIGDVVNYYELSPIAPTLVEHAKIAKVLMSGVEFIGKLPEFGAAISTPVKTGAQLPGRFFTVAHMAIHLADAAMALNKYHPISKTLAGVIPHVYSIAGGYMGALGLKKILDERKLGVKWVDVACNAAFVAQGTLSLAGTLLLDKHNPVPMWFKRAGFYITVSTVLIPMVKTVLDAYVKAAGAGEEKKKTKKEKDELVIEVEKKQDEIKEKKMKKKEEENQTPTPTPSSTNEGKKEKDE